ncbi:hypothetical protein AVEN_88318-1 [Araneus ventricosus]|uniref:Uncharacterized protein n=1 Tax=Araneus ventricosus TaxID=182803 RepID=A0A4Y2TX25_ARAVE|nr:hypothetical protein AVEN_88318-1 [Araneus ventricosus]
MTRTTPELAPLSPKDIWPPTFLNAFNAQQEPRACDLVILNLGRMTRMTLELALPLQTSASHRREDVSSFTYDLRCRRPTYTGYHQCNWA